MSHHAPLTLESVAADPASATFAVATPAKAILAPLTSADEEALAGFFGGLSHQTRLFYSVTDGRSLAHEHCQAIARYDKLRLLLRRTSGGPILALVAFSLDLTTADAERYAAYGIGLSPLTDCRWGLCVADEWQSRGVGTALAPPSFEIASRFGRNRVLLWGGVQTANTTAVRFYRSVGFTETGHFLNSDGVRCIDMLRSLDALTAA